MYKFEYRKEDFLSFSKLRQMSFEKIENLLDYLSDVEEELEEVIFRKDRILFRTSKKVYLLENLIDDSYYNNAYGVLWER